MVSVPLVPRSEPVRCSSLQPISKIHRGHLELLAKEAKMKPKDKSVAPTDTVTSRITLNLSQPTIPPCMSSPKVKNKVLFKY